MSTQAGPAEQALRAAVESSCAIRVSQDAAAAFLSNELDHWLDPSVPPDELDGLVLARLVTHEVRWVGKHFLQRDRLERLAAIRDRYAGHDPYLDAFLDCILDKHEGRYWNRTYLSLPVLEVLLAEHDLLPSGVAALLAADIARYELCAAHRRTDVSPVGRPEPRTLAHPPAPRPPVHDGAPRRRLVRGTPVRHRARAGVGPAAPAAAAADPAEHELGRVAGALGPARVDRARRVLLHARPAGARDGVHRDGPADARRHRCHPRPAARPGHRAPRRGRGVHGPQRVAVPHGRDHALRGVPHVPRVHRRGQRDPVRAVQAVRGLVRPAADRNGWGPRPSRACRRSTRRSGKDRTR